MLELEDLGTGGHPAGRKDPRRGVSSFLADLYFGEGDSESRVRSPGFSAHRAPHKSDWISLLIPCRASFSPSRTTAKRGQRFTFDIGILALRSDRLALIPRQRPPLISSSSCTGATAGLVICSG